MFDEDDEIDDVDVVESDEIDEIDDKVEVDEQFKSLQNANWIVDV